jgi:anti-sigma B factor antagonist
MSAPPDALRVEAAADGLGLVLHGELSHVTVGVLAEEAERAGVAGPGAVVVDVTGLHFCDSSGLAALIGLERRVRRAGGAVALRGVHGSLQRLLRLTGVDAVFAEADAGAAGMGAESG